MFHGIRLYPISAAANCHCYASKIWEQGFLEQCMKSYSYLKKTKKGKSFVLLVAGV